MSKSHSASYAAAGVNIEAGYEGVKLMRRHVERTNIPGVLSGIGGFGGLFAPDFAGMKEPVLVSGTDGVGTKQRIAQLMDRHDTVGIDCVAMCVNDIACCGAKPLFFLDYIAIGKNDPQKVADLVSGVAEGCVQAGCALIGGETAEHPGVMSPEDYDLAGFSLVRKVFDVEHADLGRTYDELGAPLGDVLLTPTRIYVKSALAAIERAEIHGVSHITGGGFYENVPRMIPDGLCARLDRAALRIPPVFALLQRLGGVSERDMFNTFNMGVGMMLIASRDTADAALDALRAAGEDAYVAGEIVPGDDKVTL